MNCSNRQGHVRQGACDIARTLIAVTVILLAAPAPWQTRPVAARGILLAPPGVTGLTPSSVVAGVETVIEMTGANIGPTTIVTITSSTGGQRVFTGFAAAPYTFSIPASAYTNAAHDISVVVGNDGDSEDPPRTIDVIPGAAASVLLTASPPSPTTPVLSKVTYNADVKDGFGNTVSPAAPLEWTVSPSGAGITLTAAATPSYSATFQSSLPGNYNITARVIATPVVATSASIEVVNAGPFTVRMEPSAPQQLSFAEQRVFTATLFDRAGNQMAATFAWTTPDCTSSGGTEISPAASSSTVAEGATATFYAPVRDDGSCWVQATVISPLAAAGRLARTATAVGRIIINVTPATATLGIGQQLQFVALITDTDRAIPLPSVPISWTVQPGAGAVTSDGLFTAGTVPGVYGNPGVRAAPYKVRLNGAVVTGDDFDTSPITILPGPINRIVITPTSASLIRGATQLFTVSAFDAANNPVPNASFSWSLTNPVAGGIEVLNAAGTSARLTAGVTIGAFPGAIIVSSDAVSATADVNVVEGTVTRIELNPVSAVLGLNQSLQFSATVYDNSNNLVSVPVNWSADPSVGSVSTNGLFTALGAPGIYANGVKAQAGDISATATVEILPVAPTRIAVTPVPIAMPISTTRQFQATLYDALNRPITDTRLSVLWSSAGAGRIESSGPLTAQLRAGIAHGDFANGIVARYGATIAQSVTVRVLQPVVTLQSSVGAGALNTDGLSRAYMTVTVDSVNGGGRVGPGVPVELRASPEDGTCTVTPAGVLYTDINGQAFASMTCLNYTLSASDIDIEVRATLRPPNLNTINSTINHRGRGRAFTIRLPTLAYPPITNNHDACVAAPLSAGVTIYQAANNTFNLYLLTASKTSHTFSIDGYQATGELQLFRVTAMGCPVQASIVTRTPLTQGSTRFTAGNLTPGALYILAVKTNAPLSTSVYRLRYE